MKNLVTKQLAMCVLAMSFACLAFAGTSVEVRLKNGSTWRGNLNDNIIVRFVEQNLEIEFKGELVKSASMYIIVKGDIAGIFKEKLIYKGDIRSMRTLADSEMANVKSPKKRGNKPDAKATNSADEENLSRGVFVLPMSGTVGQTFRAQEIKKIGRHADSYGPGQIIVILFDSHGGLASAMEGIHNSILDLKKRHRVVAWIKTAISAAAASSLACDEIYFMTEGTLGAMTAFAGTVSLKEDKLQAWLDLAGSFMENGGRSPYIAHAMITAPALLSYDKDPETGKVTWYNDLSGQHALSNKTTNLVFTSSVAVDSGFADGIADTGEELAKLLDLSEWREIDDYGRSISKGWNDTVKKAQEEIPRLMARRNMVSGTAEQRLGAIIRIDEQLIKWIDKAPSIARGMIPPKGFFEREIRELRKQLADLRKRR